MRLKGLISPLVNSREYKLILNNIENNKFPIGIHGISESSSSYIISGIYENLDRPVVILTSSEKAARNLYDDMSLYYGEVYYFPSKEYVFYNIDAISGDLRWQRLKVIREILKGNRKIIVTSIENIASSYIPKEYYLEYTFKISLGDEINLKDIRKKLIESGYERLDTVVQMGQFSIRGGILDIFPPTSVIPFRIEFFGEQVDSIRTFNLDSQRSIEKLNSIEVFPAKEIILKEKNIELGVENIKKDLESTKNICLLDAKIDFSKIEGLINKNLESLIETKGFENIDSFTPYFYEKTSDFFDYVGNSLVVIEDNERCLGKLDSVYYEYQDSYKMSLERGNILKGQGNLLISKEILLEELSLKDTIVLNSFAKQTKFLKPRSIVDFSEINLSSYQGQIELLINDIKEKKDKGYKILILSGTKSRGERLSKALFDRNIDSVYKDTVNDIEYGKVIITYGSLYKGFEFPDYKLSVISDKEVFGEAKKKKKRKVIKGASKLKNFMELKPLDYVVHVNHGIGIYKGIKQLEIQGIKKDYLEIKYDGADKLYVPVEQLDMVQKYIGNEKGSPKINKLGGPEWSKAKAKVKNSINEIAKDLVKLYAIRSTVKGHVYSKDLVWQKQFEDEFPYEETKDQITAIEDIKGDMESDKPMDRLLCGDVGYGKTEVAQRAAFKAAIDGKQIAILVPTTILAQQHYNNFTKRFSSFPIKVDMISRFRSAKEQKATLKAVKEGNVDILIGTHRIIQKDIVFKDLGLLVIDEEQRFGVTHKEKIKEFKKNIDVLTLSATPIPRTLHMSLTGVRDISVIETPPENRYPIQTYVVEYSDQLIRDAILREINRGGQIYFVYNRVTSIKDMAATLQKLVPEARIAFAHGKLSEKELENVIMDFINNEFDILVTTTIIETGMDIQNVNTMIIYDADKMGLSQLYQLRGRVGRSNKIAYAYFTYRKDKVLTEVAEKRLKAIKEFTELGSGFKIAMRDLEIRGAGNMVGSAQHGHMAAIGYDLYVRMLEDTIKVIKGEIEKEPVDTSIDLKVDAYIPTDYIEDETLKIEVYKKIASIDSLSDKMEIEDELIDRFNDMPNPVINLIGIAYLKSIGKNLGIANIKEKKDEIALEFEKNEDVNEKLINVLIRNKNKNIMIKNNGKPYISINTKGIIKEDIIKFVKEVLEYFQSKVEQI
ncbi:MAG: transcription-repair coupling factor [Clostridiaceae bacterium]